MNAALWCPHEEQSTRAHVDDLPTSPYQDSSEEPVYPLALWFLPRLPALPSTYIALVHHAFPRSP